jgi:tol-pal system beta propeller repeat protein TolB
MQARRATRLFVPLLAILCVGLAMPIRHASGQRGQTATTPPPAGRPSLGRVSIESLSGPDDLVAEVLGVLNDDLAFAPDLDGRGPLRARVTGRLTTVADGLALTLRVRTPDGVEHAHDLRAPRTRARRLGHEAADVILHLATGRPGAFAARLLFSRRMGAGDKRVYLSDWDGRSAHSVSRPGEVAVLPAFGPRAVWYSIIARGGVFITKSDAASRPVIDGNGLDMGVAFCGDRMFFTSSRDGDSDIYSADHEGRDVRQLTNDPAIDVSPSCGPEGRVYFVSNRTGRPQVHSMRADGSLVLAITDGAEHQTPSYCTDGTRQLLATTRIDARRSQIAVRDLATHVETVVTSNGEHQDPAFSPDCRMLAYAGARGVAVRSLPPTPGLDATRERLVIAGAAETLRWGYEPGLRSPSAR